MTIKITVAGKFDRKTGKLLICDIPKKCKEEIGEIIEDESSNESQNYYEIVLIELKVKVEEISSEKNQITVLIAHRLSTIMHADKIFVLEQGSIIESGKHQDLLNEKGLYYAMWRQQIGERK